MLRCASVDICSSFLICEPQDALEEQKEPGAEIRGPGSATSLSPRLWRGGPKLGRIK